MTDDELKHLEQVLSDEAALRDAFGRDKGADLNILRQEDAERVWRPVDETRGA